MYREWESVDRWIVDQKLVRVERSPIDDRVMQVIPLGYSDTLFAAVYVYDFHVDGLLFLRRDTISDISENATCRFQRQLLLDAGDLDDFDARAPYPIDSFASLLGSLPSQQLVILEEEAPGQAEFWIGRFARGQGDAVWIHEFTGAGNWLEDLTELDVNALTCCQLSTNYIRYYQRHFERHGFPALPAIAR